MAKKPIIMKKGNKGLTAKINLWALDKYKDEFDSLSARLWIRGVITHADTGEELKFNDPGQLLSILGKWNTEKFRGWKSKISTRKNG